MDRFQRPFRAGALLLILAFPLFGGGTPPRNWGQCPAVISVDTTEVVYALGDTHGDYDRLVKLLVAGKLIAAAPVSLEQVTWSGGRSILVVTGDMIDKWDHSLKVIRLDARARDVSRIAGRASRHLGRQPRSGSSSRIRTARRRRSFRRS